VRAFRVAYDGRPFHGFQRQPDVPTVEDTVLAALRALSVLAADGRRYLMMNAPKARLDAVKSVIPGLGGPTVMDVEADADGNGMVAVHAVVAEDDVFATIAELKSVGASGILVTEIERLVECVVSIQLSASISRFFSCRESCLIAYSRDIAADRESNDSTCRSVTGVRPRVYFAPSPASCSATRRSTSVV